MEPEQHLYEFVKGPANQWTAGQSRTRGPEGHVNSHRKARTPTIKGSVVPPSRYYGFGEKTDIL